MKKNIILFCLTIVLLFDFQLNAQNIEFTKTNFSNNQEGLKTALKNQQEGDNIVLKKKIFLYTKALEYYLKANDFNPNNALLNYKIGICYINTIEKKKSLKYFQKAYELDPKVDLQIHYGLAQGYHQNLMWDEASKEYNKYLSEIFEVKENKLIKNIYAPLINKKLEECENGKILTTKPVNVEIVNVGKPINSEFTEHTPLVLDNQRTIIFTSRRENQGNSELDYDALEFYENIYVSKKSGETWSDPEKINLLLTTGTNYATVGVSADGLTLFIYKGDANGGDIYESKYENNAWTLAKTLPSTINSSSHESSATITPNGKRIYFVTNRDEDTFGGRDIFYSDKDENGKWGKPVNLGSVINTKYEEEGVFICEDGKTLFFSSTGHNSMGGYDLFKATLQDNGEWTEPINLGYPLNTPDDELSLSVYLNSGDSIGGYFSTLRDDSYGRKDIYQILIKPTILPVDSSLVVAKIDSIKTETPVIEAPKVDSTLTANKETVEKETPVNQPVVEATEQTSVDPTLTAKKESVENESSPKQPVAEATEQTPKVEPILTAKKETVEKEPAKQADSPKSKLIFKVQIAACGKPLSVEKLKSIYSGDIEIITEKHQGMYKYLIGELSDFNEALELSKNCGTNGAFIVVYKAGVRLKGIRAHLQSQ